MLIVVLSVLAISVTLFGVWARRIVNERSRLEMQQARQQAIELADAGLRRAIARVDVDPTFKSEVWTVTPLELGGGHGGEVRLNVVPNARRIRIEATAEYPSGTLRTVRITKTTDISEPASRGES